MYSEKREFPEEADKTKQVVKYFMYALGLIDFL